MERKNIGAVLVIGGGIGGMQAALDLGDAGYKVYLVESKPAIGGMMAKLDKTFPTNDCSMCTIAPRLIGTAQHPNLQLLPYTELESVSGQPGHFTVTLRRKTRYIDASRCTGCGLCAEHCPAEAVDEYNFGLIDRASIYLDYPQAIPRVFTINREKCLGCGTCSSVCGVGAINYSFQDTIERIEVGAIIAVPGSELFNPTVQGEYGYGRYPNVVTSLEFERILSPSGPYRGLVMRPYDGKIPQNIAFIQCVGSRTAQRNWCSSVCCMHATKQSIIAKEHTPGVNCTIFYIDLRAFGKGFEAYFQMAKKAGVRYIRCMPSAIKEVPENRNLSIQYRSENGALENEEFNLVVLSCGLQPSQQIRALAEKLGLETTADGFCATSVFSPVETNRQGIFSCGPFTEPKDIPETVAQASAAAAKAMALLAEARGTMITPKVYPPEISVDGQAPRVAVFICHCGKNIGGVVNVPEVVEYVNTLPNVVHAEHNLYTCSTDTQKKIIEVIHEKNANRVVVASCTPRTHEALFRATLREAGLNPYLFEMANIRDQCSWVHIHEPEKATKKAKDLVRMAIAKVKLNEPLYTRPLEISHDALVIGGGLAGMTATLELAEQGFLVHLVEKEPELGGYLRRARYLLNGEDVQRKLGELSSRVKSHKNIHVYTNAVLTEVTGSLGNFESKIAGGQEPLSGGNGAFVEVQHGIIIVATGADSYKPTEFLYQQDERVLLNEELEQRVADNRFEGKAVAFIQCVGSRNGERPYCSRTCCSETIKNALKIKERRPETDVYVLYREVRAYGFREAYYRKAREHGVAFIRFADDKPPTVVGHNGKLSVIVHDAMALEPVQLLVDNIILAAATIPRESNKDIAQMLKIPLSDDKFFLEAHRKLRPVDFATDGIFLCGNAHSPLGIEETISQALGAAARAATILSKKQIELEPTISHVVHENCDGCAYCVDPCPFKAITLIEYEVNGEIKKRVQVNESICKGCGTCMATCPKKAIYVWHFRPEMLSAEVKAALGVAG